MGAQVGLTQLDPTNQRFGEAVSGSWSYQKLPKNHPTKYIYIYIYICIKWMISLSLSLKTSVTQFYFLLKERQRELKKKSYLKRSERCLCYETKWFPFWLWFHSQPWVKIWMVKQFIIGFGIFQKVIQRLLTWLLTLVSEHVFHLFPIHFLFVSKKKIVSCSD